MLLGASTAWGQVQVYQSWKLSTADGKLLFLDFDKGQAFIDNAGDAEDNIQRDFVDIAYAATGLDLLTIDGDELWVYFGGVYPQAPDPLPDPDPREKPQKVLGASDIGLVSLTTLATDPFAAAPTALLIGQAKGKPVFRAFLCEFPSDFSSYSCTALADEFPRPVASAFIPAVDATGDLDDGGWVLTGGTEVVFIKSDGTTTTVVMKRDVLSGGERITDIAFLSGDDLLLATDGRRVLKVGAVAGGATSALDFTDELPPVDASAACLSLRDQRLTVDVTEDEGETLVMVSDFACGQATLFDGTGGAVYPEPLLLGGLKPESGTVAEGEFLDLRTCLNQGGCPFDKNGDASITVEKVEGSANAILYFVENMVDCRCAGDCESKGIPVGLNGEVNWIDFLPEEVKNLVADPTYIPGYLEGSLLRQCRIKAFIVKTEEGTRTGIAEGAWEIGDLMDDPPNRYEATRCETGIPRSDDPVVDDIIGPGWDVVIYSPTRGKAVCPDCDGGPIGEWPSNAANKGLESNLAATGCGSSLLRTRSKSIFGIGFTVLPINDQMPGVDVTDQLITDLGTAIEFLAQPLLTPDDYAALWGRYETQVLVKWETANAKFTEQPNAADTALTALTSQLRKLQNENASVTYDAGDPDNIQGEVETRIDVLLFFIDERLRSLVPLDGYVTVTTP
jgi:hypothetical protein